MHNPWSRNGVDFHWHELGRCDGRCADYSIFSSVVVGDCRLFPLTAFEMKGYDRGVGMCSAWWISLDEALCGV